MMTEVGDLGLHNLKRGSGYVINKIKEVMISLAFVYDRGETKCIDLQNFWYGTLLESGCENIKISFGKQVMTEGECKWLRFVPNDGVCCWWS
jgi:hypothetical protein